MVKKFLILLTFLFIFNINVNAQVLGTPLTSVDYVDSTSQQANASIGTWWDTQYYVAPFRIGYFTSATAEANKIAFYWGGANLCSGQNLKISGQIGALTNFFSDNSYSFNFLNNNQNMTCAIEYQEPSRIGFTCVGLGGGDLYIALNQHSFTSRQSYEVAIRRDFDLSCEVTNLQVMQQDIINTQNIINSQNSNTQNIINNQNQNAQDIIDAHNQNAQDIIDNQNTNTDKEIESQQVCSSGSIINLNKDNIVLPNSYLSNDGGVLPSTSGNGITDYYELFSDSSISFLPPFPANPQNACFYTSSKTLISCFRQTSSPSIPENAKYIRFTLNSSNVNPFVTISNPQLCKNGNQAISDDLNTLNDTLKNDSPPDTENQLNDLESDLISDTPITDLITLPINLINSYISGFNGSCSPFNLGNLYGTAIIFPCLDLQQTLGSNLWSIIDGLFSIFMIYNIAMLMIQAFEGFTSLRDDYENLYVPRHADLGYQPKHGGGN